MKSKFYREYVSIQPNWFKWGLHIKNAGHTHVPPYATYPDMEHPTEYYFEWEEGRKLSEYQLILITSGSGYYESESCSCTKVMEGSIILLFKGEWHRYRPDKSTGWKEYWVGFDGDLAQLIMERSLLKQTNPVIKINDLKSIMNAMLKIFDWLESQKLYGSNLIPSQIMVILAQLENDSVSGKYENSLEMEIIQKIQLSILDNFTGAIDFEKLSQTHNISYSWMRKKFREIIGMPPHSYLLQLRIQKARDLLIFSNHPIKQIAIECGFSSAYYFSRYFKLHCSYSPSQYRKKNVLGKE
ncbi:AraC family transcriptional regulator [Joostella atrarenae]|uniref:AraC family transcriptional regulator n=1 Tax=Joostella atrarenae TaxID=679257 RepID=A0ABS9J4X4_9FLAO|nr:AraC family transcriptional regulator [Joostella atrarenae]MCF8715467.1 AraC family transcriptional regulator [Joostella atrarenae]